VDNKNQSMKSTVGSLGGGDDVVQKHPPKLIAAGSAKFLEMETYIKNHAGLNDVYLKASGRASDDSKEVSVKDMGVPLGKRMSVEDVGNNYNVSRTNETFCVGDVPVLMHSPQIMPQAMRELGDKIATMLGSVRALPMRRGKAHSQSRGKNFQFGVNPGQGTKTSECF
jgi:hypothetical protein